MILKNKYFLIFFVSIFCFLLTGNLFANKKKKSTQVHLENSIIIEKLKMDGRESFSRDATDYLPNGEIIYDNNFENTIVDYDKIHKSKHKFSNNKKILFRLRKKDRRWHISTYRIKSGDNLWKIAKKFNINYTLIIKYNNIKNKNALRSGEKIFIPNRIGIFYKIKYGDKLVRISKRFGISVKKIKNINRINKKIYAGRKIFLPDVALLKKRYRHKKTHHSLARFKKIKKYFIWPLHGRITSGFGYRHDPFSGKRSFHCGVDISANVGTPVHAAAAGVVIFSGWKSGYGKVVIVRHKKGFISVYAHNHKLLVKNKTKVKQGQLISYSGMTGAVTGAHLHFEIRKYLTPLNPLRFLKK